MLHSISAAGYSGSAVELSSSHELVYVCGNGVVLRKMQGESPEVHADRLVRSSSGFGVQTFAVNREHGLLAVAEKVGLQIWQLEAIALSMPARMASG
jgi:hypothetical protein